MQPPLRDRLAAALAPRYLLERELASGGMGIVFAGRDPVLDRQVAIKVLPPERATAVAVERFLRESRLLARLTHPHIVPILEAQHQGDLLWFVMPLVAGDTLAVHLATKGPLPVPLVRRLGIELLDALAHSHRHGVIHRDIKPANIFLQGTHALLADFGVAHLTNAEAQDDLTAVGESVGTPNYMAPEQRTLGVATERSDLYALGATLFEVATGKRWRLSEAADEAVWNDVPCELAGALRRALEPQPEARWANAEQFALALGKQPSRRKHLPLVASFAIVGLVAAWWLGGGGTPRVVVPTQGVAELAFLPFDGGSDSLGTEIPRAVAFELERFPRLDLAPWERTGSETSRGAVRARRIVTGHIVHEGGGNVQLQIGVRGAQDTLVDGFRFTGTNADVAAWGAAIADSIVSRQYGELLTEFRMTAGTSPNLSALRQYFAGQDAFQRDQWPEAVAAFQEARRLDSSLVRATWAELIAVQWQRLPSDGRLEALATHPEQLPPPLDALVRVQMQPDFGLRLAALDALAARYPRYSIVQQLRANELFHRGPLVGRSLGDGVKALADGAAHFVQLNQADTYLHLIWGAVRLGDQAMATSQLKARERVEPPHDNWGALLSLAVDSRFHPIRARFKRFLLRRTVDSGKVESFARAVRLGLQLDDPEDQLLIGGIVAERAALSTQRASGESAQSTALLLIGQPEMGRKALQRAARQLPTDPSFSIQHAEWALLLPLFGVEIAKAERDGARQQLAEMSHHPSWGPRASWALLLDATRVHDTAAASHWQGQLHTAAIHGDQVAVDLEPLAQAVVLGMQGHLPEAMLASESIHLDRTTPAAMRRGPFVRSATYFLRGNWQLARGDRPGAEREWLWHENNELLGWPDGEPQEGELDVALSAVVRLHRGENLQAMGELGRGCSLLARVAVLWRTADAAFTPLKQRLTTARARCP